MVRGLTHESLDVVQSARMMHGQRTGWAWFSLAGCLVIACGDDDSTPPPVVVDGSADVVTSTSSTGTGQDARTTNETGQGGSQRTDAAADVATPIDTAVPTEAAVVPDARVDAGANCNVLVNVATPVTPTAGVGAAPVLTGGAITPGIYAETKIEQFGGDAGVLAAEQSTLEITASTINEVVKVGTAETRFTSSYSTTAATIAIDTTCDSTMKFTGKYSSNYQASPTIFVYAFDNAGGTLVKTYTKR